MLANSSVYKKESKETPEGETKASEFVTPFMIEQLSWSSEDDLEAFSSHQGWWE